MREMNHWPGLFGSAGAPKDGVTLCPAISRISAVSERMTDGKRANAFEDIAALSDWIHSIGSTLDAAEVVRCCGRDKSRYVQAWRMYVRPGAAVDRMRAIETGLQFRAKSVNGSDCFVGAVSRDEANLGKESACPERQA